MDILHRLPWLWSSGDMGKLRVYAEDRGLAHNDLCCAAAQAVLEMAAPKSKERTLRETVVVSGRGRGEPQATQLIYSKCGNSNGGGIIALTI